MPKPPGREISIISDWGSGIKLSAVEDGLPEKIGFFSRWTHFQFVAESTFVVYLRTLLSDRSMVTSKISDCLPVEDDFAIS